MPLFGFEKKRREHDPKIAPVSGSRGNCALCGCFSDLTESHILPKSAGNRMDLRAYSYGTSAGASHSKFTARRFKNGLCFKTLCKDCNSRLGDEEDREITVFYDKVKKAFASPIQLPPVMTYRVRANKLARGILSHMASATDNGLRTPSDVEAQEVFMGRKHIGQSRSNVFYWPYLGVHQTLIRNIAKTRLGSRDVFFFSVLKMAPLAFAVTEAATFYGLPSLNRYFTSDDEKEVDIPLHHHRVEYHEHWPAAPADDEIILTSSSQIGLTALPFERSAKVNKKRN